MTRSTHQCAHCRWKGTPPPNAAPCSVTGATLTFRNVHGTNVDGSGVSPAKPKLVITTPLVEPLMYQTPFL